MQSCSKFIEYIEKKVKKTIRNEKLFTLKDKIAVAVSGGKDSTTVLHILKKLGYDVTAVTADPGVGEYTKENIRNIKKTCKDLDVKLNIISFKEMFGHQIKKLKQVLEKKGFKYSYCMLCGILKRYTINRFARENKMSFVVTGHNLDDEAQAFLMNVFRNDFRTSVRMGAKPGILKSTKFVQRRKPLYNITEEEVTRYSKIMKFPVYYGICPLSKEAYRRQFIGILNEFEKKHPSVKYNVVRFQQQMAKSIPKQKEEINLCERCGEPASGKVCKLCQILRKLK
jgi:uncharacterized protein (TIGR00269 family)